MENQDHQNGAAQTSQGSSVPKGQPQGENDEVKEGNASQQRPAHGADGGPNTSTRQDQLPSLNNGAAEGADADSDEQVSAEDDEQTGSDADQDRGGAPSV